MNTKVASDEQLMHLNVWIDANDSYACMNYILFILYANIKLFNFSYLIFKGNLHMSTVGGRERI